MIDFGGLSLQHTQVATNNLKQLQGHLLQAATLRPPGFHPMFTRLVTWGANDTDPSGVGCVLGYYYGILLWDIIMEYHGDE